jgi:hypothetical protein
MSLSYVEGHRPTRTNAQVSDIQPLLDGNFPDRASQHSSDANTLHSPMTVTQLLQILLKTLAMIIIIIIIIIIIQGLIHVASTWLVTRVILLSVTLWDDPGHLDTFGVEGHEACSPRQKCSRLILACDQPKLGDYDAPEETVALFSSQDKTSSETRLDYSPSASSIQLWSTCVPYVSYISNRGLKRIGLSMKLSLASVVVMQRLWIKSRSYQVDCNIFASDRQINKILAVVGAIDD